MKTKNFALRYEELPAFGEFVESSFLLDRELFSSFSPRYANGFAEEYRNKLEAVKKLTTSRILTGERSRATERLYAAMDELLLLIEKLQHYCMTAGNKITFPIRELRLPELRKKIRRRNSEATIAGAKSVQQLLQKNLQVLEEEGFTKELQDELNNLIVTMETANKAQNDLLNERRRLIDENTSQLNELWEMTRNIMHAGRIIHRNNPVRKAEYTLKNVKSRVRLVIGPKTVEEAGKPPAAVTAEESLKNDQTIAAA